MLLLRHTAVTYQGTAWPQHSAWPLPSRRGRRGGGHGPRAAECGGAGPETHPARQLGRESLPLLHWLVRHLVSIALAPSPASPPAPSAGCPGDYRVAFLKVYLGDSPTQETILSSGRKYGTGNQKPNYSYFGTFGWGNPPFVHVVHMHAVVTGAAWYLRTGVYAGGAPHWLWWIDSEKSVRVGISPNGPKRCAELLGKFTSLAVKQQPCLFASEVLHGFHHCATFHPNSSPFELILKTDFRRNSAVVEGELRATACPGGRSSVDANVSATPDGAIAPTPSQYKNDMKRERKRKRT